MKRSEEDGSNKMKKNELEREKGGEKKEKRIYWVRGLNSRGLLQQNVKMLKTKS